MRNSKKIRTYSSSRSFKVIDLGINRKRTCNFLLVISILNSGHMSYRFRDIGHVFITRSQTFFKNFFALFFTFLTFFFLSERILNLWEEWGFVWQHGCSFWQHLSAGVGKQPIELGYGGCRLMSSSTAVPSTYHWSVPVQSIVQYKIRLRNDPLSAERDRGRNTVHRLSLDHSPDRGRIQS